MFLFADFLQVIEPTCITLLDKQFDKQLALIL